jgi:hypothetical protein
MRAVAPASAATLNAASLEGQTALNGLQGPPDSAAGRRCCGAATGARLAGAPAVAMMLDAAWGAGGTPLPPPGRRGATGRAGGCELAAVGRFGPDSALCMPAPASLGRALPDAEVVCGSCWAESSADGPIALWGGAAAAVPADAVCVASTMRPGNVRGAAVLLPPAPSLMVPQPSANGPAVS